MLNKFSTTDDVASCRTKSESSTLIGSKLSGTNQLKLTTPATNQAKLITMSFLHKDTPVVTATCSHKRVYWHRADIGATILCARENAVICRTSRSNQLEFASDTILYARKMRRLAELRARTVDIGSRRIRIH